MLGRNTNEQLCQEGKRFLAYRNTPLRQDSSGSADRLVGSHFACERAVKETSLVDECPPAGSEQASRPRGRSRCWRKRGKARRCTVAAVGVGADRVIIGES